MSEAGASAGGGPIFYGVVMRDKIKSASVDTLKAYRAVAEDLLANSAGKTAENDEDLRDAIVNLDRAIAIKQGGPP